MINILLSRGILHEKPIIDVCKNYIKKEMKVCIIAYSFFEHQMNQEQYDAYYRKNGEYYNKMIHMFSFYDIPEENISFIYYTDKVDNNTYQLIDNSDIIYFPGGAPDQMMHRIKEKGLYDALSKFDGIIIGSSAGAMIQQDYFHISPDLDYKKFSVHRGLGYIKDLGIEVHFKRQVKQKKAIRKISHLMQRPLYTIPDDSALIITKDDIILINHSKLYYDKQAKVK